MLGKIPDICESDMTVQFHVWAQILFIYLKNQSKFSKSHTSNFGKTIPNIISCLKNDEFLLK